MIWRSREELEELYAAGLGEVMVRTWPEVLLWDRGYGADGARCRLAELRWLRTERPSRREVEVEMEVESEA
jgi:hypothetical protein